jgi:hypothetical protein
MEKIREVTKHLDLIFWTGGHFGAFFINLVNASQLTPQDHEKSFFVRLYKNKEWSMVDYFSGYHYSRELKINDTLITQLKDIYGDKWYLHYYYILYQYSYRYLILNEGEFPDKSIETLTKEEILELATAPFLGVKPTLRFTKCHDRDYLYKDDSLEWNSKIAVMLPKNKFWLGEIMLGYKHKVPLHIIIRGLKNKFNELYRYDEVEQKKFKTVNMYDVIFNKDLTSIYDNFPSFNFTGLENKLWEIVNKDSLEILEHYGLDHTHEVNNYWDLEKLIAKMKSFQRAV